MSQIAVLAMPKVTSAIPALPACGRDGYSPAGAPSALGGRRAVRPGREARGPVGLFRVVDLVGIVRRRAPFLPSGLRWRLARFAGPISSSSPRSSEFISPRSFRIHQMAYRSTAFRGRLPSLRISPRKSFVSFARASARRPGAGRGRETKRHAPVLRNRRPEGLPGTVPSRTVPVGAVPLETVAAGEPRLWAIPPDREKRRVRPGRPDRRPWMRPARPAPGERMIRRAALTRVRGEASPVWAFACRGHARPETPWQCGQLRGRCPRARARSGETDGCRRRGGRPLRGPGCRVGDGSSGRYPEPAAGGPVDIEDRRRGVRSISRIGDGGSGRYRGPAGGGPVDIGDRREEVRSIAPVGRERSGRYRQPAGGGPVDSASRQEEVRSIAPASGARSGR